MLEMVYISSLLVGLLFVLSHTSKKERNRELYKIMAFLALCGYAIIAGIVVLLNLIR